jgi:multiple sugar transport system permease protein
MKKNSFKENIQAYFFAGPFIVLSFFFLVYPIISGAVSSLYKAKFQRNIFVGLANYAEIFTTDIYLLAIKNTMLFVVAVVPLLIILSIWIGGSIFDKRPAYVSAVRVSLYIPVIASMVVMSIIWRFILDSQTGLARYFGGVLGIGPFDILANKKWTLLFLIFILVTVNIGQCVLLYVAEMGGISGELLDASEIDGCNRLQVFRYILIPSTSQTTTIVFITETSAVMKVFVIIQLISKGGPNYGSTTMMYLLYQDAFERNNSGTASALGILMFALSLIFIMIRFTTMKKETI